MAGLSIGIFNDCFPPTIDGVANVALNYALNIQNNHGRAVVATPRYPNVKDDYPFEVFRYPSTYVNKRLGYRAGNPFDPYVIRQLNKQHLDLIHVHSPFTSALLARTLRVQQQMPIVFTYHTKYDIDISKITEIDTLRTVGLKFLMANINASDEVWAVSRGAGESLKSLGYEGDYIVMENGTDFARGRSSVDEIEKLRSHLSIPCGIPVFLYVGRMMWYKGIRITLDGLRTARERGLDFRMVFVGEGIDSQEIQDYAVKIGVSDLCIFAGAVRDRAQLRTYYSLGDLFLFPSTYDTNGIVVNEAAACSCPSLLIEDSPAAEKIVHMQNGILVGENAGQLAEAVLRFSNQLPFLRQVGEHAAESVYLPWDAAVKKAYERYEHILDNYQPRSVFYKPQKVIAVAGKRLKVRQRMRYLRNRMNRFRA